MRFSRFFLVSGFIFLVFSVFPITTHAAWWNFLFFGSAPQTTSQTVSTKASTTDNMVGVSGSAIKPTVEDLQKRINELEDAVTTLQSQLAQKDAALTKALATALASAVKTTTTTTVASAQTSVTLSTSEISAKVKPAMVTVDTATSSGSGVFIDAQGHILTTAHNVWTENKNGVVIGAANQITITLSNGSKKTATLVGIDEANDVAVLQLATKSASSYLKLIYDNGVAVGNTVYVASVPTTNGGGTGGTGFVGATVSAKTTNVVTITSDGKPYDTGGALVNSKGDIIGIPGKSSCKVIEDMSNCLKYSLSSQSVRIVTPKLLAGMRLYKQRTGESAEETLVRDQLDLMYQNVSGGTIDFAINSASGDNTFDYFNGKIVSDQEGKIAKLYILKLKQIAMNFAQAADLLKSKAYDLNVFFINESGNILRMGDYQRSILSKLQTENSAKVKEYQARLDYWTKKKNEYDSLILKAADVNHDYLMAEGAAEELETKYLTTEKNRILNTFSGENVNIF